MVSDWPGLIGSSTDRLGSNQTAMGIKGSEDQLSIAQQPAKSEKCCLRRNDWGHATAHHQTLIGAQFWEHWADWAS